MELVSCSRMRGIIITFGTLVNVDEKVIVKFLYYPDPIVFWYQPFEYPSK